MVPILTTGQSPTGLARVSTGTAASPKIGHRDLSNSVLDIFGVVLGGLTFSSLARALLDPRLVQRSTTLTTRGQSHHPTPDIEERTPQ